MQGPFDGRAVTRPRATLRWLGWSFVAAGVVAILAPGLAPVVAARFVAAAMLAWGALGLWMAFALRPSPEWRVAAVAFGLLALAGLVFLVRPDLGGETLTLLVVAGCLAEGVVSIAHGLRASDHLPGWGWMIASGAAALVVGLVVLIDWPRSAIWLIGLLLGIDFISTGLALIVVACAGTWRDPWQDET